LAGGSAIRGEMQATMPSFRITIDVDVDDPGSLWALASSRLIAHPGMTGDDLLETLGPREDPDLASCLTLLIEPGHLPASVRHLDCAPLTG